MRGVRASGRGEAASACEVQSVPPGLASAVASCAASFAASLRSSGRGVYVDFKAGEMGPNLMPEMLSVCVLRWFHEGPS